MSDSDGSATSLDITPDDILRRVKVYELRGGVWTDLGTGFCHGYYDSALDQAYIVVRSEESEQQLILETRVIAHGDVYNQQQTTLIVWHEPDGSDYALSFEDPDGCQQVWDFIGDVKRHFLGGSQSLPGIPQDLSSS